MPFWRTYYHLVWTTKKREALIRPEIESRLYGYLESKARELGVHVYAIGGWTDHVHLVVAIPPRLSVAEVVKGLKGASAFHMNHGPAQDAHFAWQRGYGVFSLGEKQRPVAEAYVRQQKEHHSRQSTNSWLERTDETDDGPACMDHPINHSITRVGATLDGEDVAPAKEQESWP